MLTISNFFWQMCLLRKSPADLPSSNFVTAFTFIVYLAIAFCAVTLTRPSQSLLRIAVTISVGIALQVLVTWGLLHFKGLRHRFRATWTALLGTNAIMLLVLLPFNMIVLNAENDSLRLFADSATWVCIGWWLAIAGNIYHKASKISIIQGSAIAFLVELVGIIIAFNLFPPPQ